MVLIQRVTLRRRGKIGPPLSFFPSLPTISQTSSAIAIVERAQMEVSAPTFGLDSFIPSSSVG
ncbi:MAG: hypothetical protein GF317_09450 [Candidatus Lokiarchaeota archaeon]|nr:hypothetical protein [Candidatus Lokiarchaeota archaeon]MBD3199937.1 hypothetical protein [Candidatus Lokiarchaeota archaeon]